MRRAATRLRSPDFPLTRVAGGAIACPRACDGAQSQGVHQMRSNLAVLTDKTKSFYERQVLLETRANEIAREHLLSRADFGG